VEDRVKLEASDLQRYFYRPRPGRSASASTASSATRRRDLKDIAAQAEQSLGNQLFRFPAFREVPTQTLQAEINQRKLNIDAS